MAGVYTFTPGTIQHLMQELRYELMEVGHDISEFHASQDRQSTRNRVFDLLQDIYGLGANIVYGKKSLIVEHDRSDVRLHAKFGLQLVESVVCRVGLENFERLIMIFDRALTQKHQAELSLLMKPVLKRISRPFHLYFQSMKVDMNGQIADYVAWSKFVALERGEMRPWESLSKSLKPTAQEILDG